jgi:hypothetical protein
MHNPASRQPARCYSIENTVKRAIAGLPAIAFSLIKVEPLNRTWPLSIKRLNKHISLLKWRLDASNIYNITALPIHLVTDFRPSLSLPILLRYLSSCQLPPIPFKMIGTNQ